VVRVDEVTGRGVVISTDVNTRFAQLDPYAGAQHALAESYRNVAVSGGVPTAVSDCLNFGSPEDPGVMWQFERAVTGLADGCMALGIPVTGGNVSFYNQTGDTAIHPTPLVAVLGVIDDVASRHQSGWSRPGQALFLLGTTGDDLDGSLWAQVAHEHLGGLPPPVDLGSEKRLAQTVLEAGDAGMVRSAHDLSAGGLALALAEGVLRHGVGVDVDLEQVCLRDGIEAFSALFSESGARAIVTVDEDDASAFVDLCAAHGHPVARIGTTGGEDLAVQGLFRLAERDLRCAHTGVIQRALQGAG
jgi:phosphoribosylformylglycinamidine synthase